MALTWSSDISHSRKRATPSRRGLEKSGKRGEQISESEAKAKNKEGVLAPNLLPLGWAAKSVLNCLFPPSLSFWQHMQTLV